MFNLDASVSNDDLRQIFGAYGEVKEVQSLLSGADPQRGPCGRALCRIFRITRTVLCNGIVPCKIMIVSSERSP